MTRHTSLTALCLTTNRSRRSVCNVIVCNGIFRTMEFNGKIYVFTMTDSNDYDDDDGHDDDDDDGDEDRDNGDENDTII